MNVSLKKLVTSKQLEIHRQQSHRSEQFGLNLYILETELKRRNQRGQKHEKCVEIHNQLLNEMYVQFLKSYSQTQTLLKQLPFLSFQKAMIIYFCISPPILFRAKSNSPDIIQMLRIIKSIKPATQALAHKSLAAFGKFDCDSCSKRLTEPECRACERMVNYFHIFSIPQNYKIDPEAVKMMARDLQKQFHPDKWSENTGLKQKMEKYSSYINEAKAILLNDLQRAIYLMDLKGMHVEEDLKATNSEFVEEIFALQEEIQQARTFEQVDKIRKRLQEVLAEVQKDLQLFFTSDDLEKCREFVIKYKYLSSALMNAKQKLSNIKQNQHQS